MGINLLLLLGLFGLVVPVGGVFFGSALFDLSCSCFFCDWSYLLLLLDVLIKNCVRSVTVLNLEVKLGNGLAISWSFLVRKCVAKIHGPRLGSLLWR